MGTIQALRVSDVHLASSIKLLNPKKIDTPDCTHIKIVTLKKWLVRQTQFKYC